MVGRCVEGVWPPSMTLSQRPHPLVVNNAAPGYVKALQNAMHGGRFQSSDLVEMDYAGIAKAIGSRGIRRGDELWLSSRGLFRYSLTLPSGTPRLAGQSDG